MQDATHFWDSIADKYSRRPIADMDAYTYTLDRTRSYLKPTDSVLELGCGTGGTALLLAPSVARITASDLSPEMIRIGRAKADEQAADNVNFVAAGLMDDALRTGPFDAVLAMNLLHLLPDPRAAAQRVAGLLEPGGLFISKTVTLPSQGPALKLRLMSLVIPVMQCLGKAPFVNFMRVNRLEQAMTDAGFEIVESDNYPTTSHTRYIVARRL